MCGTAVTSSQLYTTNENGQMILKHNEDFLEREKKQQASPVPLVVLPGLPTPRTPCFRKKPLHWLAVPVINMMDAYKRNLAKSLSGRVLFVEPLTQAQLEDYYAKKGSLWEERCKEDLSLSLKDIHKSQSNCIEENMIAYHTRKNTNYIAKLFNDINSSANDKFFAVDGVHPNDEGYEAWGRHIGLGIVQELKNKKDI